MKLLDFRNHDGFNQLRKKMKAQLVDWDGDGRKAWNAFDPFGFRDEFRKKGEVDIPFSEINLMVGVDGTFELYGQKVLVFIRDQRKIYDSKYKFHIVNCRTLREAQSDGKYEKYVASTNTDGKFMVNIIYGDICEKKEVILKVCKNCLTSLDYKGYKSSWNKKDEIYETYSLEEYFSLYKEKGQNIRKPKHTNVTAPLNNYTGDFREISEEVRQERNYTCEACQNYLSSDQKFLHVHHIDGIKNNNRQENLKVLCIGCHSKQPGHGYMKNLPDLREYQAKYPSS